MTPTTAQLRYLKAIQDFFEQDGWYPGADDLIRSLDLALSSTNAVVEMLERLEGRGWVEWPLGVPCRRTNGGRVTRLSRRSNSIRLTELGRQALRNQ